MADKEDKVETKPVTKAKPAAKKSARKRAGAKRAAKAEERVSDDRDPRQAALDVDEKANDGEPHIIRMVNFDGEQYGPGDEDKLKAAKMPKEDIERLTAKGAIIGF